MGIESESERGTVRKILRGVGWSVNWCVFNHPFLDPGRDENEGYAEAQAIKVIVDLGHLRRDAIRVRDSILRDAIYIR